MSKKILVLLTSDYNDIVKKGVTKSYETFKEGGYFDKVLCFCPFTKNNLTINYDNELKISQYGWKTNISYIDKFRITKFFGIFTIFFKLLFVFPKEIILLKPDIIRSTDPYIIGLIAFFYSKVFRLPFVLSIHSDYEKCFTTGGFTFTIFGSRYLPRKIENFLYHKADAILPISEYLKKQIILTHQIPEDKFYIFYHGLDFESFDSIPYINIHSKYKIDSNIKLISYIARLSKEKNCLDILHLVSLLIEQGIKDFIILVAGDGPEKTYMENYVKEKNMGKYIQFLGFQTREYVVNLRKQSYLSLCLFDGHSLIEACAGARPVVAYNTEWHYELVKDNETGCLVEDRNVNELARSISFLFENPSIADQYGKNIRKIAFARHNISNIFQNKQTFYQQCLKEKRHVKKN